jgi:chemotaxis protein methyltransferase CheR
VTWRQPGYAAVADLLAQRTGLSFSPSRQAGAEEGVRRAMTRSGAHNVDAYLALLQQGGAALDDLIVELTVGETWFFREPEQLQFIRRVVLPELKERAGRYIRFWSAGCASGEEAYTLAILLAEEGLAGCSSVLATDISHTALAKARQAVYTSWSLRGEGAAHTRGYLTPRGNHWIVSDDIRRSVTFARLNLALGVYPSLATDTWSMDVILCRNVLIYFDEETIRAVAARLFAALAPGGWLFTASSDPPLGRFAPFECVVANEGVFYRRPFSSPRREETPLPRALPVEQPAAVFGPPHATGKLPVATETPPSGRGVGGEGLPPSPLDEARGAFAHGEYARAVELTAGLAEDADACVLRLRALANLDPARAERESCKAVARHSLRTELHYLHATLLLAAGKPFEAARAIRRALYLDHSLAVGHCVLGAILERCGNVVGARRAWRNAYELCRARPPDEEVPLADGERAGSLAEAALERLALLGGSP